MPPIPHLPPHGRLFGDVQAGEDRALLGNMETGSKVEIDKGPSRRDLGFQRRVDHTRCLVELFSPSIGRLRVCCGKGKEEK
jgi:hypothetical protein